MLQLVTTTFTNFGYKALDQLRDVTLSVGTFRPFKIIDVYDVGANRKRVCDFVLVRNTCSNLGPILHSFGDFAAFMCSWPHSYSTLILRVFPLHHHPCWGQQAHKPVGLLRRNYFRRIPNGVKNIPQRHRQTDGRTDDMQSHNEHRAVKTTVAKIIHKRNVSHNCLQNKFWNSLLYFNEQVN